MLLEAGANAFANHQIVFDEQYSHLKICSLVSADDSNAVA
jgi:hypothetical protein